MSLPFINSKNDYFNQAHVVLLFNWGTVDSYLTIKGYSEEEISVYKKAYFYFIHHPLDFDGATMTEDLYDVYNLDLDAMLHDFYYIKYNVSASYKYTQIADRLFYKETLRKGKSSWNAGARKVLLKLKSWFGFSLYAKYIAKRIMTNKDKELFMKDVTILTK